MTPAKQLYSLIESWEEEKILDVIKQKSKNKELDAELDLRYGKLIRLGLSGGTFRSLINLPKKWTNLKNEQKVKVLEHFPEGCPFFTNVINLNAAMRTDAWRYSYYSKQIPELPAFIGKYKNVTELHLIHQQFKTLPESLGDMEALEVLNLEDNDLTALPESIINLRNLKVLILELNYGFENLPDFIHFPNLEILDLRYTKIKTLPESFFRLKNLKKIVTENSSLDHNIEMLRRIKTTFPDAKLETTSIAALKLEDNVDDAKYIGKETIEIREFNLNILPSAIFKADAVKSLKIDCYHLLELPDSFGNLQTLESLSIKTGKEVTLLPDSITTLKNLKKLSIDGSYAALPDNIGDLHNLEELEIDAWHITTLPESFSKLIKLQKLLLKNCKLSSFAPFIQSFSSLKKLHLEDIGARNFRIDVSLSSLNQLEEFELIIRGENKYLGEDIFNLPGSLKKLKIKDSHRTKPYSKLYFGKLLNHFNTLEDLELEALDLSKDTTPVQENLPLRKIFMWNTSFPEWPDTIGNLKNMTDLILLTSGLQNVNPAVYNCSALQYFRMTNTTFTTIPEGIEKLQALIWFGFESGKIEKLPEGIFELTNLKKLVIDSPLYSDKSFKAKMRRKIKGIEIKKEWYG